MHSLRLRHRAITQLRNRWFPASPKVQLIAVYDRFGSRLCQNVFDTLNTVGKCAPVTF